MYFNRRHFKAQVIAINNQVKWNIDHHFNTLHPKSFAKSVHYIGNVTKVGMLSFLIVSYGNKFIHIEFNCYNMTANAIHYCGISTTFLYTGKSMQ